MVGRTPDGDGVRGGCGQPSGLRRSLCVWGSFGLERLRVQKAVVVVLHRLMSERL